MIADREDTVTKILRCKYDTVSGAVEDKSWNWPSHALRLIENGDFESGLFYINLCLDKTKMPASSEVGSDNCAIMTTSDGSNMELPMSEGLKLLEKRCLVYLRRKEYDKVVQDAQELLRYQSNYSLAYKCLLAALCKLNQLERVSEVLRSWKSGNPSSIDMIECRTKLESLMEAVARGIDPRQAFSNLEDLLGLNYEWLMKPQAEVDGRWKHRPLPPGKNSFVLCLQNRFGHCSLGSKCPDAHGQHELEEWKTRTEMENNVHSDSAPPAKGSLIIQNLLNRISEPGHESLILTEDTPNGIKIKCAETLRAVISCRKIKNSKWKFVIESKHPLLNVCLLHETYRQYFRISSAYSHEHGTRVSLIPAANENDPLQVVEVNKDRGILPMYTYSVTICFNSELFGSFRQTVVFDFGFEPIPIRNLSIEVNPPVEDEPDNSSEGIKNGHPPDSPSHDEDGNVVRKKGTWNFGNAEIVNGLNGERVSSEKLGFALIGKAKPSNPNDTKEVLVRDNYKEKMRFFLTEEERARQEIISKYNLSAPLQISDTYSMTSGFFEGESKYAVDGGLFGRMTLFRDVSEDTAVGRLILRSCRSVLLTKTEVVLNAVGKPRVYWCEISDKTKNSIYITIGGFCVKDLNLKKDDKIMFDIQFQLDRTAFMEQKDVIDRLTDAHLDMLFPDFARNYNIPWSPTMQWDGTDKVATRRLNPKQKEALIAVSHEGSYIPPILLIGPFGTGKTFTLAQCIRKILQQPTSRIMICTQSNSAADLYIKEYLHMWVKEGFEEARPLRIYYALRSFKTVHPTVLNYCIKEFGRFKIPTKEDILAHRVVVVTLGSSYMLMDLNLPSETFSHIFLDEAAQAMESEAITPLLVAGDDTKLVLAGDHMQLSPELFCDQAKNFHSSLLERLHCMYPESHPCKLMLCENYRSHAAIIQFASESFYNKKLECGMSQPVHDNIYPLSFFAARGEDVQEPDSTSYFNMAEVYEVEEKVSQIIASWPESWGDYRHESAIGVLTPYADQVSKIRARLRKQGLTHVSVERVLNVQGKQFRVVLLSTVRTHKPWVRILPEAVGKEIDFGFFSNPKLLNTALTRAQSLVAVVGDPVSLCSVGKCRVLWEDFIRVCHENRSLHGISFMQIKQNILGVEMRNTWGFNPLAKEFVFHPPKHSPASPKISKPASPQPVLRPPHHVIAQSATQTPVHHPINGVQPSHSQQAFPVIPPYAAYRSMVPVAQPIIRPYGAPPVYPPVFNSSPNIPGPTRFGNVVVPHPAINAFVPVPHAPMRFVRPNNYDPQPSTSFSPTTSPMAAHSMGSQYYGPPHHTNDISNVVPPHVRADVPTTNPSAYLSSHHQQPSPFSENVSSSRQTAHHAAGVPLFRRGLDASNQLSNIGSFSNPIEPLNQSLGLNKMGAANAAASGDQMSTEEMIFLQEVLEQYALSSGETNTVNSEDKIKSLRSKLGLTVSEPFNFSSNLHSTTTSGNNPLSFDLTDLNVLENVPRRGRNIPISLENSMACVTPTTSNTINGMNNNSQFTTNNPRGNVQPNPYSSNTSMLNLSSQHQSHQQQQQQQQQSSSVWFSDPSSTPYSNQPDRSASCGVNNSNNPNASIPQQQQQPYLNLQQQQQQQQSFGNNPQSTYRINQQYLPPHHHLRDLSIQGGNNYSSHVPDLRSHSQAASTAATASSISSNPSSSGNSTRSYANVVKQATAAPPTPIINNNIAHQQQQQPHSSMMDQQQKYIALMAKHSQSQVGAGPSGGGGVKPGGQEFNGMNMRKSQR